MRKPRTFPAGAVVAAVMIAVASFPTRTVAGQIAYEGKSYPLFPVALEQPPPVPSPLVADDGTEVLTCVTSDGKYVLVPVTIENGEPLDYENHQWWGKGRQLDVDAKDFPALSRTGLHSDEELDGTREITGVPVGEITRNGRPGAYSAAGFMGDREDIVSVLKGDNGLVRRLGLTHAECARPLFHVFNAIVSVKKTKEPVEVTGILYGGNAVQVKSWGHKGWQKSIFDDEILGYWEIEMQRDLDEEETDFLARRYADLGDDEMTELEGTLTFIHTGEMVPFYIMRYGFYEGHTSYRADPIAVARIFGLKSIEEIDGAFEGGLYEALTRPFTGPGD